MSGRGEKSFIRLPRFGARMYDSLMRASPLEFQINEIAQDLLSRVSHGRLLDIGTGPGRLLIEIHKLNPDIELFGLDISNSMVQRARKNLAGIKADLRQGNIGSTDYESGLFDIITCTGSFYLWDHPEECLEEVHRILKKDQSAFFFETYREFNEDEFRKALRANLREVDFFRRMIGPFAIKKQLRMTYRTDEFAEILENSSFADSYTIEKTALAGLPIWLRIKLTKKSKVKP